MKNIKVEIKRKCHKCDYRGHIQDDRYSAHSCDCEWAIERTKQLGLGKLIIKKIYEKDKK